MGHRYASVPGSTSTQLFTSLTHIIAVATSCSAARMASSGAVVTVSASSASTANIQTELNSNDL